MNNRLLFFVTMVLMNGLILSMNYENVVPRDRTTDIQLVDAVRTGKFEDIKQMITDHKININHWVEVTSKRYSRDEWGQAPLHIAIDENNYEMIQFLLDNGASVGAENILGNTPLYCAALYAVLPKNNEYGNVLKLLIARSSADDVQNCCKKMSTITAPYFEKDAAKLIEKLRTEMTQQ